ncbi:hypothetical protein GY03_01295 [Proteus vulgaris]|uniref:hypothetical protein n=1 Tax=Proteus vulgaris TaxID=585 RepID=UPI0021B125AB|nr:hypothetical protein [Proteus vulgaris]MCT6515921.1 hypothetical protein [Proteus vulgaris]
MSEHSDRDSIIDFWEALRDLSNNHMRAVKIMQSVGLPVHGAQKKGIEEVKALIDSELKVSDGNKRTEKHYTISTKKLERAKICIHGNLIQSLISGFDFINYESKLETQDVSSLYDYVSKLVEINNLLSVRREFEHLLLQVTDADEHLTNKEKVAANHVSQQLKHFLDKDLSFELKLRRED